MDSRSPGSTMKGCNAARQLSYCAAVGLLTDVAVRADKRNAKLSLGRVVMDTSRKVAL